MSMLRALATSSAVSALSTCLGLALVVLGCSGTPPPQPRPPAVAQRPPTPASVTVKEPGGDAESPHRAALERLLAAPWGARNDKDDLVWAPAPDWENWRRVHYFGVESFTGFRYGDEHHTMAIVFVQDVPDGTPVTSETCIR